jgi:hypothetical protein
VREVLKVGDTREKFCEDDERVTTQRLEKLLVGGNGEPAATVWWCLDGDHRWGERPKSQPPLEEPT